MGTLFVTGGDGFVQLEWDYAVHLELEFSADGILWVTEDAEGGIDSGELSYKNWATTVDELRELVAWVKETNG